MKRTKQFLALVVALLVISCDKDFNTIGTDLVDGDHFNVIESTDFEIKTSNLRLDDIHPVQTNNLSYTTLGYFNDPVYGSTTANIFTQVGLSEYGKDFEDGAVLTKAVLSIPYFSRKTLTNVDGSSEYELDSVYGGTPINLKLFRSNYFLNEFDPATDFEDRQKYYSNEDNDVTSQINLDSHNTDLLFETNNFLPINNEYSTDELDDEGETVTTYFSPRFIDENLALSGFSWLLNPDNTEALSSANNFKDFFRGMYFQASLVGGETEGVYVGLDLSQAEIEFTYEFVDPEADPGADPSEGTIKLLFNGGAVNTFYNDFNYVEDGDKIYLKGGEGSMASIELFSGLDDDLDGISNELEELRAKDVVINEANLEFYVDQNTMQNVDEELDRVFLYDINNNTILLDYNLDNTSNTDPNYSKVNHLGRLERDDTGRGVKYKIRITEHVTNLVKSDSTNLNLGLLVSNNVNLLGSSDLKSPIVIGNDDEVVNNDGDPDNDEHNDISSVLSTSINSHKGTVLFNENAVDDTKKLKLRIIYTDEDN